MLPATYIDMYITENTNKFAINTRELIEIFISWIVITLAFSWKGFDFNAMLQTLPIIALGTLTGFIVHELAHKFTAMHYGIYAAFYMWPTGLLFAIIMTLATGGGFVFAAPGAVYIFGHPTKTQNGIISVAGPIANLILAIIFIILTFLIPITLVRIITLNIAYINLFLGAFNLIPIPPLDGFKVFVWNKATWFILLIIFVSLFFLIGSI